MPGFAILRTQKLKHLASVHRSLKHSFREQDTPNADQQRTPENSHEGAHSASAALQAIADRLPEKRRKDAVLAIEYLVTASPEAMQDKSREQQDAYFADSLAWLRERHGAANVVYAGIHRDERTPHMYAYVVPLDEQTGRLNARKWLGGARALRDMQTEFAAKVGERHGLVRGIEHSRARHQTVQEFYGALEQAESRTVQVEPSALEPRVLRKGMLTKDVESPAAVAERISEALTQQIRPMALSASQSRSEARRARELQEVAQTYRDRLQAESKRLQGLTREQQQELHKQADALAEQFREENRTRKATPTRSRPRTRPGRGQGR